MTAAALKQAATVESAVDGITRAIRGALQEGDLTVVWLFDASHSLVDDRQRIAARLESFLAETVGRRGQAGQHGRFLRRTNARTRWTDRFARQGGAVRSRDCRSIHLERRTSSAPSANCVGRYHSPSSKLLLVVWTDESGDDAEQLEKVIQLCRGKQVAVHVVGPSAVLGADTGFHAYTDPKTEQEYLLPVTRGPDAAVAERIRLGYWFLTRPPVSPGGVPTRCRISRLVRRTGSGRNQLAVQPVCLDTIGH